MWKHWGLGPVFAFECVMAARRSQLYVGRALFVLALLGGLALTWAPAGATFQNGTEVAAIADRFFVAFVVTQMVTVLLVAPAATAGSVCVDKSRGTLLHAMVTDLGDREIVFGKLWARLAPVLALLLCGLPVLMLSGLLGGVDPAAVFGAYLVTAGVAVLSGALGLVLSVWARKPHQALLPAYGILAVWIAAFPLLLFLTGWPAPPIWSSLHQLSALTNPFTAAFASQIDPGVFGLREQGAFLVGTALVALVLVGLSARSLRGVAMGQASRPARRDRPGIPARILALLPGPSLDRNPVLWREWHRKRPSRWTGRMWTLYAVASGLASLGVIVLYFAHPLGGVQLIAAQVNAWQVTLGLLLLSVSAASALAEERDRGSLDVIMATPLPSRSIVLGKWWGTFALIPRLAIFPTWVSVALAMISDRWEGPILMVALILAYSAAIASLGVALGTWVNHLGRAVAASVLAFALVTVGWTLLLYAVVVFQAGGMRPSDETMDKLMLANPFYGIKFTTEDAGWFGGSQTYWYHNPGEWLQSDPGWPLFWIVAYASTAAMLLAAVLQTFDQCLGRVPVSPGYGRLYRQAGLSESRMSSSSEGTVPAQGVSD